MVNRLAIIVEDDFLKLSCHTALLQKKKLFYYVLITHIIFLNHKNNHLE